MRAEQNMSNKQANNLVAWGYWIGIWSGNAAIAITGVSYMSVFFPLLAQPIYATLAAILMVWILTWINTHSIKLSGIIQVVSTILKLIPLLLIGTLGWFFINTDYYAPFNASTHSNFSAITLVASLTLWAFIGIESATVPATHIKDPEKTIPRATLIGTLLTAIIYVASTMVIMGLLSPDVLKTSIAPFADAVRPLLGDITYSLFAMGDIWYRLENYFLWWGIMLIRYTYLFVAKKDPIKLYRINFFA
jgi:APA family basic amino acid/polyamine antiporter